MKNEEIRDVESQLELILQDVKRAKEKTEEIAIGLSEFEEGICALRASLYNIRVKTYFMKKGGKNDEQKESRR